MKPMLITSNQCYAEMFFTLIKKIIINIKLPKLKAFTINIQDIESSSLNPNVQLQDPSLSILNIESACGDGEVSKAQKCSVKRGKSEKKRHCKLCTHFKPTNLFTSTQRHRTYPIINHENKTIDCDSVNVIYLMTCSTCHLQYVGETCQKLKGRWASHISGIQGSPSHQDCPIMVQHFSKGICKDSDFTLQIIENLKGNGRMEEEEEGEVGEEVKSNTKKKLPPLDKGVAAERRKRETFWIKTLRTAYPYGLNDRIGDEYKNVDHNIEAIGKYFLKTDRKNHRSLDCSCLLYTSPSPRDRTRSRMPSSA